MLTAATHGVGVAGAADVGGGILNSHSAMLTPDRQSSQRELQANSKV